MRVAQVTEFGGPEVLVPGEVAEPVAGAGEVVVDVAYADTIFLDTQLRAGAGFFPVEPPYVPGVGAAGTVRDVGAGVDPAWAGRRVAVSSGHFGTYAEQLAVPVETLVPVPDGLGLREAAAMVVDGPTTLALAELTGIGVKPDEQVLVLGASGGMGTLLVQLAHARGARVVAVARGERKLALVRELGADVAVDASHADWPERARAVLGAAPGRTDVGGGGGGSRGADIVLDGVGGQVGLAAFALTADGGRFSAHGAPSGGFAPVDGAEAERRGITLFGIGDLQLSRETHRRYAAEIFAEAAAGRLRPVIGETFPLNRAADAHAAIEGRGLVGKVLLKV